MNTVVRQIMYELRLKDIQSSVGVICDKCNQSAFYFNRRNTDLYDEKNCLMCSKVTTKGILLEDFLNTLCGRIGEHYKLSDSTDVKTISLNQVLARFTYEHDEVLGKLSELLCHEKSAFFKLDGRYESLVDDAFISKCKEEAIEQWDMFSKELKHMRRFTHAKASRFYENLIGACVYQGKEPDDYHCAALRVVKKGTALYRGRLIKKEDMGSIKLNAKNELSAPPEKFAANGRMSPPGIAFMYMADEPHTVVAELHAYVGDIVAMGEFKSTKDLNFFDFTALEGITHEDANILSSPLKHKYFQHKYLLNSLHSLISKPFRATDISYIETQMFAETIRNYKDGFFDGIIFESSQRQDHLNYVLFGDYPLDDNHSDAEKRYDVELQPDVHFYQVEKIEPEIKQLSYGC